MKTPLLEVGVGLTSKTRVKVVYVTPLQHSVCCEMSKKCFLRGKIIGKERTPKTTTVLPLYSLPFLPDYIIYHDRTIKQPCNSSMNNDTI